MTKGRAKLTETTIRLKKLAGERLALLADLNAMGPVEMERCLGMTRGHFRLIKSGERPISLELGLKVCEQFHVTLDWLYRGVGVSTMAPEMLVNIAALRPDLIERPGRVVGTGTELTAGTVSRSRLPVA